MQQNGSKLNIGAWAFGQIMRPASNVLCVHLERVCMDDLLVAPTGYKIRPYVIVVVVVVVVVVVFVVVVAVVIVVVVVVVVVFNT